MPKSTKCLYKAQTICISSFKSPKEINFFDFSDEIAKSCLFVYFCYIQSLSHLHHNVATRQSLGPPYAHDE